MQLASNDLYVEKLLCKDAAKIVIDEEFKYYLKSKIMVGANVTELPKHKNNYKNSKYFKIASGVAICVFVSGTIFKVMDVANKNIFTKNEGKSDVIMPISSSKNLSDKSSSKIIATTQTKDVAIASNTNMSPSVATSSENTAVDNTLVKNDENSNVNPNMNVGKGTPPNNHSDINPNIVKGVKNIGVTTTVKNTINVPKMENVKNDASSNIKFYDSSHSSDEKSIASVKDGGIYVKDLESSKEIKLIAFNEKTQIVEKPNFTPNDEIIYYKAEKVKVENGASGEKNGAIYITDKNGQESSKLVDGEKPMISKDGKNLVYENEGKIFILNLETNNKRYVDNGKYPAFSNNGKTISYVKEDNQTQNYDASTGEKEVYIKKSNSSLWIFNLSSENTFSLTNNEVNLNNNSIQSWVEAVRNGNVKTDLNITSKYSYYESIWSSDNKEIYVIRKNNDEKVFEFIEFKLDK